MGGVKVFRKNYVILQNKPEHDNIMNTTKKLMMLIAAAMALLSSSGQVTFTGVGEYPIIEVTPETGAAINKIYVIFNTDGIGMTYHSASDEREVWYSYDSRGIGSFEEVSGISWDDSTSTLSQVLPNRGYLITEGNNYYSCWIVNYADYYLELNDLFFDNESPCSLITFNVDGHGSTIPYYTLSGDRHVLDREIELTYNTLVWDDIDHCWWEQKVVETFPALDQGVVIVPPLCNTMFTLVGDRFKRAWGLEDAIEYSYYLTQAVDCRSTAVQKDANEEDINNGLGGSAPVHIVFAGYPTDAVVDRVWEIAFNPNFENVIQQFNQDEVDNTFNDVGTYYVRYKVANANGSCVAYGDTYIINISKSETPVLPGDVNGDHEVNIADINAVIDVILGGGSNTAADVNGDGEINIADVNAIIDIILGGGAPTPNDHEWVDLGLPSGTLWATCNVGANTPEEYGDYFAWGETEPKEVYNWNTNKWGYYDENSKLHITKYNITSNYGPIDNKTELEPEDDAAYVNWGPSWRMPTYEQVKELIKKCSWQWMTRNGVAGLQVTGPNGNSIFLPNAGYRYNDSLYESYFEGYYWSRSLYDYSSDCAYRIRISEWVHNYNSYNRYFGYTVRPVRVQQ